MLHKANAELNRVISAFNDQGSYGDTVAPQPVTQPSSLSSCPQARDTAEGPIPAPGCLSQGQHRSSWAQNPNQSFVHHQLSQNNTPRSQSTAPVLATTSITAWTRWTLWGKAGDPCERQIFKSNQTLLLLKNGNITNITSLRGVKRKGLLERKLILTIPKIGIHLKFKLCKFK